MVIVDLDMKVAKRIVIFVDGGSADDELVTDDRQLHEAAKKRLKVLRSREVG